MKHPTPALLSPTASPPHSHSRQSSSTRFSGKISSIDVALKTFSKPWDKQFKSIKEGLLDDDESEKYILRRCNILGFIISFLILFSLYSLILYGGASKPQKPKLTMSNIIFERFVVQPGSDFTGVPTYMVSINSTIEFTFRNTAAFFGLYVTSTQLDLSFIQIPVGSGNIKKFYQLGKSQRLLTVPVVGDKIPLYASGQALKSSKGIPTAPVPLKLSFVVRSRAYVLGKLVKPTFFNRVECSVAYYPNKINVPMSLKNNCTSL